MYLINYWIWYFLSINSAISILIIQKLIFLYYFSTEFDVNTKLEKGGLLTYSKILQQKKESLSCIWLIYIYNDYFEIVFLERLK